MYLWVYECYVHIFSFVDWAEQIVIPSRFSAETTSILESGVLKPKARDEIVNTLSTLIVVHTIKPTTNDYNTICSRLIKKRPVLKDHIGTGYVGMIIAVNNVLVFFFIGFMEEADNEIQESA